MHVAYYNISTTGPSEIVEITYCRYPQERDGCPDAWSTDTVYYQFDTCFNVYMVLGMAAPFRKQYSEYRLLMVVGDGLLIPGNTAAHAFPW